MKLSSIAAVAISAFLLATEWGQQTAASMPRDDYRVLVLWVAPLMIIGGAVLFVQAFRGRKKP